MLPPESLDRDQIKFPKITMKAKSLPGSKKDPNSIDMVSAKSWLYYTPNGIQGILFCNSGFKTDIKR